MKKILNKTITKLIIVLSLFLIYTISVYADEESSLEVNYSSEYEKWIQLSDEEKENTPIPISYDIKLDKEEEEDENSSIPSILNEVVNRKISYSLGKVSASYKDSSFNLADNIAINVKNQKSTKECWAFSAVSSLETNIALNRSGDANKVFSARHLDYATTRSFLDGTNLKGYKRELGGGGSPIVAFGYFTNGTGAVLEKDMPFVDDESKIKLSEIEKNVDTIVTGYEVIPGIYKKFDNSGNISYYDSNGKPYTTSEVTSIRNKIKNHIIKNGGIASVTAGNELKYYNNSSNPFKSTAYFCNDPNMTQDHGITIIGWDDTYSRDNFNSKIKPKNNGAYLVLNSYGTDVQKNGYYYISYDDVLIEKILYGVTSSSSKDYDNIYQNDFYGGALSVSASVKDTGYLANVYSRTEKKNEILNSVGITSSQYAQYEIYVNPKDSSLDLSKFTKVATTSNLPVGYNRININPIRITGEKFAIVIKQKSLSDAGFEFIVETQISNTYFEYVTSSEKTSFFSGDGKTWNDLKDEAALSNADICIKAFTTISNQQEDTPVAEVPIPTTSEPTPTSVPTATPTKTPTATPTSVPTSSPNINDLEISSEAYKIENWHIKKVKNGTNIKQFKNNVKTNATKLEFRDENNSIINNENTILKTGYKLLLNGAKQYTIVVRGDINKDGKITLTDLSKLVLHYNSVENFILSGASELAGDLNLDNKISLVDISQLLVLYSEM